MKLVFNEISVQPDRPRDDHVAREWMEKFIATLTKAEACCCKGKFEFYANPDLRTLNLMAGYPILEWVGNAPRGQKDAFVNFVINFGKPYAHSEDFMYLLDGVVAQGLGHTLEISGIAISLSSRIEWDIDLIEVEQWDLTTSKMIGTSQVDHACCAAHMERHQLAWRAHVKHAIPWGGATKMDLDDATAQRVLNCTIQHGDQRYGHHQGKLYCFQTEDHGTTWHGYPIGVSELARLGNPPALEELIEAGFMSEAERGNLMYELPAEFRPK